MGLRAVPMSPPGADQNYMLMTEPTHMRRYRRGKGGENAATPQAKEGHRGGSRIVGIAATLIFGALMAFAVVTAIRSENMIEGHVQHMSSQEKVVNLLELTSSQEDAMHEYESDPEGAKAAFGALDVEARELLKEIAAPGGADSAHGGSDVPAEAPEAADAAEATSQRHETMPDAGQTHEADSSGRSLDAGSGGRAQFAAMPAGVADSGGELTLVAAKPGDAMSGGSHESPDTRTERRGAPTTRTPLRRRASKPRRPTRESQSWSASPTAPGNVSPPSLACATRVAPSPKAVATQVIVS